MVLQEVSVLSASVFCGTYKNLISFRHYPKDGVSNKCLYRVDNKQGAAQRKCCKYTQDQLETAVHGYRILLILGLVSIMSLSRVKFSTQSSLAEI